jgi:hypothetical protein
VIDYKLISDKPKTTILIYVTKIELATGDEAGLPGGVTYLLVNIQKRRQKQCLAQMEQHKGQGTGYYLPFFENIFRPFCIVGDDRTRRAKRKCTAKMYPVFDPHFAGAPAAILKELQSTVISLGSLISLS